MRFSIEIRNLAIAILNEAKFSFSLVLLMRFIVDAAVAVVQDIE